jgi:hypothetical protein
MGKSIASDFPATWELNTHFEPWSNTNGNVRFFAPSVQTKKVKVSAYILSSV